MVGLFLWVVAEKFIRTIKNKIYKYMTSISKNVYIDKLDDIVHKYNNKMHRTIQMKPIDVKDNTYIDFGKENSDNDPKFKVDDHVRILKYKNIFAKRYTPNWSEELFMIKIKNTVPWTYVIDDLNGEEFTGTFYEKELQKIDQQEFRIEKVIKKKGDKLYVKWKGYDNPFNSWINKNNVAKKAECNKLVTKVDNIRHKDIKTRHKDLLQKTKFDTEVKKVNDKIASNSSEVLTYNSRLNQSKYRIDDLERYASYFRGKNYFDGNDGVQNTLVFQAMQKHFNLIKEYKIDKWKSRGLSNQYLDTFGIIGYVMLSKPTKPIHVIFKGKGTLVQHESDIIAGGPIININIVYKTSPKTINSNFVFRNYLFGAIKITNTTNSDTDKWKYSGYGVGCDSIGSFTHPDDGKDAKNVVVFGADMANSIHATNKTESVLVLGHGLIQKINDTTIYAEKMYPPNFTVDNKIFCLSLHYNGDNSYLFVNGREVTKFKADNSELIRSRMCFGGLSKDYDRDSIES